MEFDIKKYKMEVEWDRDDKVFVAKAPAIQGAVIHGDTREEALENLEAVMIDCLEAEAERRLENADGISKFLLRMPAGLKEIVIELANSREMSMNELIVDFVRKGMQASVSPSAPHKKTKAKSQPGFLLKKNQRKAARRGA